MGLWDSLWDAQKTWWTGGLNKVGDKADVTGKKGAQASKDAYTKQQEMNRKQSTLDQLGYLDTLKAPEVSPQVQRRIAMLNEQSQDRPIVTDPFFQGQRAQVVQGGAQALAGVANQQMGRDVRGGFQNTGNIQDVYDRLGAQLAGVGQNAAQRRDQAAQQAAEMDQAILDKRIEFDNAKVRAQMAIAAGDAAAAQAALQQAFQAQSQIDNMERQFYGGVMQIGGTIAGGVMGGPAGAVAGNAVGSAGANAIGGGSAAQSGGYNLGANTNYGTPQNYNLPQQSTPQAQYTNAPYSLGKRLY